MEYIRQFRTRPLKIFFVISNHAERPKNTIVSVFFLPLDQFSKADLNVWNNHWRTVYDYTWNEGDNWTVNEDPIAIELPSELLM